MPLKGQASPLYFDPVKIGQNLQEVGIDYLQVEAKEIETRWFRHAESETDVFVWFDKTKKIIKQQVSHMGQLTEWNIIDGLKTGCLFEAELVNGQEAEANGHPASEVIQFDREIQAHTLKNALKIIENMSCLSSEIKEAVTLNFVTPSLLNTSYQIQRTTPKRTGFWNKLLGFFK